MRVGISNNKNKTTCRSLLRGMAILLTAGQLSVLHGFSVSSVQAAVVEQEQGTVVVQKLSIRKKAGGTAKLKTVQGNIISLKQGKQVTIKSTVTIQGVSWYHIQFRYQKQAYQGYVKQKKISILQQEAEQTQQSKTDTKKGLVNATLLNVRTTAEIADNILEYQTSRVGLVNGTEVTILSEHSGWYHVSFPYNGNTLQGYVSGDYILLPENNSDSEMNTEPSEEKNEENSEKDEHTEPDNEGKQEEEQEPEEPSEIVTILTSEEFEAAMEEQDFPESYKPFLRELHKLHPTWQFEAYHTELSWKTVINKEAKVGRNLVPKSKNIAWKSKKAGAYNWLTDTFTIFDGTTWVSASKKAIKYYMDPRNFLNETDIYQFEVLDYNSSFQTKTGVENILSNTPMEDTSYLYTNPDSQKTESITYTDTFIKAAEASGVSPYHLASRVKQEVVTGTTSFSSSATGTYSGYQGYYNFYNIGASDSAGGGAVAKGLAWAKKTDSTYLLPWTSPYRSIVGGALYIGKSYINQGQNTLYLEKFNVTPTSTYNHQYMTNVEAAYSEAKKIAAAYDDMENMPILFSIPVYDNMPETVCAMPEDEQNPNNLLKTLKVKGYSLTPTFQADDEEGIIYNLIVDDSVESVQIEAETASSLAVVSGAGIQLLDQGTNMLSVEVTAENGNIREYDIHIVRKNT